MTTSLLLHGGGGPATMLGLRAHLESLGSVAAPTHPGWDSSERPADLDSVAGLAEHYRDQLDSLRDVVVVGSSVGGWLAAELALRDDARRIAAIVLINPVGILVEGEPISDVSGLTPPQLAQLSFHDASALPARPAPTPESIAAQVGNAAALNAYAGDPYMHDPTLRSRLGALDRPTLVLWGQSDGVVSLAYGRAFATAIPGAQFVTVPLAGHLPWIEQPQPVFAAIDSFVQGLAAG